MDWEIYTEFTSKKGQDIVICNLSDHVHNLGAQEYIACPICSTPELTLGYSDKRRRKLNTDGYVGYCFRCNRTFLNPNNIDKSEIITLPKFNLCIDVKSYDIPEFNEDVFNGFSELDDLGLEYLLHRNSYLTESVLRNVFKVKSVQNGVVIPFYLDNRLVYYVIRFMKVGPNQIKYYMPPTKIKPIYIPSLISTKKFMIVEGVFDAFACLALYPQYTPVAVLGSKITLAQINYLSERYNPDSIIVYLDDTEKSYKTMKFIQSNWKGMYSIDIIKSNGTDPEEYLMSL